MAGRPKTTRALPNRWRPCCAAACSPTPRSLPRRGAPPARCSDAARPCCAPARNLSRRSHIPTASPPGPSAASRARTTPSGQASPRGVTPRLATSPWRAPSRGAPLLPRGAAPAPSFSATRPSPPRPSPCPWDRPARAVATSCAAACATPCPRATASPGGRRSRHRVAAARGRKQPEGTGGARLGTRGATRPAQGPVLQRPPSAGAGPRLGQRLWPRGRNRLPQAPPAVSGRPPSPGRSLAGARAQQLALWSRASAPKGAEQVRPAPPATLPGAACTGRPCSRAWRRLGTRQAAAAPSSRSPARCWDPRSGSCRDGGGPPPASVGCPSPAPAPHGRAPHAPPALCGGRSEGTTAWRGRSASPPCGSALGTAVLRAPPDGCGAATPRWQPCTASTSGPATGGGARQDPQGGKHNKKPLKGVVCLLTKGVLIRVRCPVQGQELPPIFLTPALWGETITRRDQSDSPRECVNGYANAESWGARACADHSALRLPAHASQYTALNLSGLTPFAPSET
jgi:hypothetical protein